MKDCKLEPDHIYSLQEDHLQKLRQSFTLLFQEAAQKQFGYQNMVASHLISILVQLGRYSKDEAAKVAQQSRRRMEKSLLYIQGNFSDSSLSIAWSCGTGALVGKPVQRAVPQDLWNLTQ